MKLWCSHYYWILSNVFPTYDILSIFSQYEGWQERPWRWQIVAPVWLDPETLRQSPHLHRQRFCERNIIRFNPYDVIAFDFNILQRIFNGNNPIYQLIFHNTIPTKKNISSFVRGCCIHQRLLREGILKSPHSFNRLKPQSILSLFFYTSESSRKCSLNMKWRINRYLLGYSYGRYPKYGSR